MNRRIAMPLIVLLTCLSPIAHSGTTTILDTDFESAPYVVGSAIPALDNTHSPSLAWAFVPTSAGSWNTVASTVGGGAKGIQAVPAVSGAFLEMQEDSLLKNFNAGAGIPVGWAEFWWMDVTTATEGGIWDIVLYNSAANLGNGAFFALRRFAMIEGTTAGNAPGGTLTLKDMTTLPGLGAYTRNTEYYSQMTWEGTAGPPLCRVTALVRDPSTTPVQLLASPVVGQCENSSGADTTVRSFGAIVGQNPPGDRARILFGKVKFGTGTAPLAPGQAAPPNRAVRWTHYD